MGSASFLLNPCKIDADLKAYFSLVQDVPMEDFDALLSL
jgi:hypothetical protein